MITKIVENIFVMNILCLYTVYQWTDRFSYIHWQYRCISCIKMLTVVLIKQLRIYCGLLWFYLSRMICSFIFMLALISRMIKERECVCVCTWEWTKKRENIQWVAVLWA